VPETPDVGWVCGLPAGQSAYLASLYSGRVMIGKLASLVEEDAARPPFPFARSNENGGFGKNGALRWSGQQPPKRETIRKRKG
jgi:hypothetical protein